MWGPQTAPSAVMDVGGNSVMVRTSASVATVAVFTVTVIPRVNWYMSAFSCSRAARVGAAAGSEEDAVRAPDSVSVPGKARATSSCWGTPARNSSASSLFPQAAAATSASDIPRCNFRNRIFRVVSMLLMMILLRIGSACCLPWIVVFFRLRPLDTADAPKQKRQEEIKGTPESPKSPAPHISMLAPVGRGGLM